MLAICEGAHWSEELFGRKCSDFIPQMKLAWVWITTKPMNMWKQLFSVALGLSTFFQGFLLCCCVSPSNRQSIINQTRNFLEISHRPLFVELEVTEPCSVQHFGLYPLWTFGHLNFRSFGLWAVSHWQLNQLITKQLDCASTACRLRNLERGRKTWEKKIKR